MGFLGQKWECLGKVIFWGKNGRFRTNKMGFLGPKLGILCRNLGFLEPKLGFLAPKLGILCQNLGFLEPKLGFLGPKLGYLVPKNWGF